MEPTVQALLSQTEIFEGLQDFQYELLAFICEAEDPGLGDVLVRENERSDDLYVISHGGVEVLMDPSLVAAGTSGDALEPVTVAELGAGQVFGEIALVDQGTRSATVRVSREGTHLLRIPRDRLMQLCDTYPELGYQVMKNLAADLAIKIRNTGLTFRQYQLLLSRVDEEDAA